MSHIDPDGEIFVDNQYTRAYLRHLFHAGEMLGPQIASIHNLAFYQWLVREAFVQLEKGEFSTWKAKMVKDLGTRL